jgi:diguanylate cyclase (GGDEF)-like protein/PAS domain S-box-containing protein
MLIRVTAVLHRIVTLIFHKVSVFGAPHYNFQTSLGGPEPNPVQGCEREACGSAEASVFPFSPLNYFGATLGSVLPEASRLDVDSLFCLDSAGDAALLVLVFAGGWKLASIRRGRNETRNPSVELELRKSEPPGQIKPETAGHEKLSTQVLLQSAALEAAANAIVITDTEAVIVWANPAFSALTGYSLNEVIGKRPKDLVKSGLQTPEFYRVMWDTIKSGRIWRGEVVNRRKDGTLYTEELTITPVHDEQGRLTHFIAVKENISARKRLEMRQIAQAQLLEKMGSNISLTELLEEMVRFIETLVPELRCSVLLADDSLKTLHCAAAPSLPDDYTRLIEVFPIAEGAGSCGTAAARRETVIVSDILNDSLWTPYLPLVTEYDWLRACWSTPFFDSTGKLLGTFAGYVAEARTPKPEESELIAYAVSLASLVVERKRASDTLRQNEEKLQLFVKHAPAALAMFDREMRYLAVSRRWLDDYRLPGEEQVMGRSHYEVFPEIPEGWKAIHRRGLAGEVIRADDERFERFDGTLQWLCWEIRPWYTANGSVGGIMIFTEDITERKEIEEALHRTSANLESVFAASTEVAIIATTLDGTITLFNSGAERMLGYTADEIIGRRTPEIFHLASELNGRARESSRVYVPPAQSFDTLLEEARHGRQISNEWTFVRKNGTCLLVSLVVTAIRDERGAISGFLGIASDITERKRAEARILNLNRVYTVLSNINQSIVRLRDMQSLFGEACRIAVEDGGFCMAWIGVPDPSGKRLLPAASAGLTGDYLAGLQIRIDDDQEGGPAAQAFREGRYVCCNDIERDPCMRPWRDSALLLGYRALISMPIKVRNTVRGIYNLYAAQEDFFTQEEIQLLEELAGDIGFAVEVAEIDAERRRSEEHLRQAAVVFESTREGVMVTDVDQRIRMVNRAFTQLTGYSESEVIGKKPSLLSSGRHDRNFYAGIWASLNTAGHWQGEIWNRRKSGEVYPELLSISAVKGDSGKVIGYVGVFADISKLKSTEAELEFLAHHDPLTGLPNRLLLLSRLDHGIRVAKREGRQLALLMIDLDRFKDVNDSFGHLMGDELLQQVSARLIRRLRNADTVTRLGGDEFTLLLEDIAYSEDAGGVANEIIASLGEPWRLSNGAELRISASIGISLFPDHGDSAAVLLQHADAALYQAKSEGRGCFRYFSESLTRAARERIGMESRLRQAISRNEFQVFYQPQVDIATGALIGAEALVRWKHAEEGYISPAKFIPVAEATGLIGPIGEWVLEETCRQGKIWAEAELPALTLAVNVSPHQFLSQNISQTIAKVLAETGFPAERLELELTESALMEREEEAVSTLAYLRAKGIRLAIDDFGTGYSSLAYLKRFPVDVLKIDKSFVDDLPASQDDREIASTIIAIAHTLGLKVLAEGVETPEQLEFLKMQGCDFYQGYLKSPPMPAADFEKMLRASWGK